jgi:hypothetical protein
MQTPTVLHSNFLEHEGWRPHKAAPSIVLKINLQQPPRVRHDLAGKLVCNAGDLRNLRKRQ